MNVDKIRRMNVLTNTLKEHGLAATREDAVCLAGEMVGTKNDEDLNRVFVEPEQSIQINNDPEQTSLNENDGAESAQVENKGFSEEQIKNILQSFSDQFCTEIKNLSEKIESQEEKYLKLQQKFENLSTSEVVVEQESQVQQEQQTVDENVQPVQEEKSEVVQETTQTTSGTSKPPQSSGRCGEYNSNDVSIDKFFYYGQK